MCVYVCNVCVCMLHVYTCVCCTCVYVRIRMLILSVLLNKKNSLFLPVEPSIVVVFLYNLNNL